MSEPTTLAAWAAAIAQALRDRGVDAEALLVAAGLDPDLLQRPGARYPTRGMTRFWQLAVQATEPALALQVPRHVQPATMHALGLSLRASRTLEDALLRMARYSRLVTDAADIAILTEGPRIEAIYRAPQHDFPLADAAYEAFMATAVDLGRALAGTRNGLLACEFRHAAPANLEAYQRHFACPLRFGARHNRLVFDRAALQAPLASADATAARLYDVAASEYLARFDADPVSQRVRERLIQQLPSGEPTREAMAAILHMTPRTLLRRLAREDTDWKTLLNEVRRELAFSYLRQGRSAAEITYLIGFGDPANFTRAFKRWTGTVPTAWRRSKQPAA